MQPMNRTAHTSSRLISRARPVRTLPLLALGLLLASLQIGCGSTGAGRSFMIPAGEYEDAFATVREELRAAGYTLERVDSIAGEISTGEKTVVGVVSPLAPENRTATGMLADTLSNRPRTVRVRFRDATDLSQPPKPDALVHAEVDAIIWRKLNPGWRIDTETTFGNQISLDPLLGARGVTRKTVVPLKRDDRFASVLTKRITKKLERTRERTKTAGG